jgi:hypothetical protein
VTAADRVRQANDLRALAEDVSYCAEDVSLSSHARCEPAEATGALASVGSLRARVLSLTYEVLYR